MLNTRKTVRALVSAFNVNNYDFNAVKTNFKLQSEGKKDYIVVSFDKSMDTYQCSEYLDSIKRKIIREFYGIEESNDAEILDTAKLIFDVNSFPFDISNREWSWDKQHGCKFVTPVDEGVIFNLKSHLAFSLKKDVQEDMSTYITPQPFDKKTYLWRGEFDNKGLLKQFEREFLSRMRERYENAPKNPLKVEGNSVYIKDVFDDARFIDSVTRHVAWRIGIDLGVSNDVDHSVMLLKDSIINSFYQSTKTIVAGFMCASPLNREEASILMPLVLDSGRKRMLTNEEALELNCAFNYAVFNDLYGRTQGELSLNGSSVVYGIDFSNKEISHCVITKIIESSVINKDHELAIDPERALSPAQSPFNSPTHAGLSGLRTPPNQRKKDTDSGYDSNSPPKPKDSGSSSGGPSSDLTELSSPTQEFPTQSQGEELGRSPRQGSEKKQQLHNPINLAGPSKGFSPSPQMNSIAVSQRTGKCVSAAKNVQAGTSAWTQQPNRWSLPAPSAGPSLWQPSKPSSWKGANPVGANPWSQQTNPWLSQGTSENKWIPSMQFIKPGSSGLSWSQSGPSSSRGANESVRTAWYVSSLLTTGNDPKSSSPKFSARSPDVEDVKSIFSVEPEKQQVSGECSEAESQESESPKKRRGDFLSKISAFFSLSKSKHDASLNRCDVGRDTTRSVPAISVTEKPPVSKRFFSFPSRVRAENNSPSKETSPVTEACTKNKPGATELENGGFSNKPKIRALTFVYSTKLQKSLDPDQREELPKEWEIKESSVKAQLPGERSSQASADSGLGKLLERGQSPSLIEKFNDKSLINSRVDSPDIKKHLQEEKEVFV